MRLDTRTPTLFRPRREAKAKFCPFFADLRRYSTLRSRDADTLFLFFLLARQILAYFIVAVCYIDDAWH